MFDESKQPYFKDLPLWLQRDILIQQKKLLEFERAHQVEREQKIEQKCTARGYGLNPSRGDLSFPPRRRARRPVGDFSLLDED